MAILTQQQIIEKSNKMIRSGAELPFSTPHPLSSTLQSQPVTSTKGYTEKGGTINNYLYYGSFPEQAVAQAEANANNSIADKVYAEAYNRLVKAPQEAAQELSERYIDGRNIKDVNPAMYAGKVLANLGAGATGALAQISATAYAITQQIKQQATGKNKIGTKGVEYFKTEAVPAIIESAQSDPLAFGSQIAGGVIAGAAGAKGVSLIKKAPTIIKSAGKTDIPSNLASKTITDSSGGLTPKQIAATALTNKDSLNAVPGTVTHTLTKKEIALRQSIGNALKSDSTLNTKQLISISKETEARNAAAPITLNVAEINTKFTGVKESQQSGFAVSIKPATVKASNVVSNSGSFVKSKPKDMSKRSGKTIVQTLSQSNKPTIKYSAGPNQREIILQYDPSQNVYMKLRENGNGRYDYIGDLTDKQLSQLEKLDTRTGNQAKNREYAILNEEGYVRPDAGKFTIPYKNEYSFNIEISKGKGQKYRYKLVDQIFHKSDNFPTEINGNIASKLIDSIEDGRDIQLKSAGERWQDYKASPAGRGVAFMFDPADYAATQFTGTQTQWGINRFATAPTAGAGIMPDYGLTPMQKGLRKQRMKWESETQQRRAIQIVEGIESSEKTLPDGITNTKTYPGNSINLNLKGNINPISQSVKNVFITKSNPTTAKPTGRPVTPVTSSVKTAPAVKPKSKPTQKSSTQPQQTTQAGTGIGISTATLAGTMAGAVSVPIATATVTGQTATAVIDGTIPLPATIPTTETISQIIDNATSTSTATATSTAVSTATALPDALADTATSTDATSSTYNTDSPLSIPVSMAVSLAVSGGGTSSNGNNNRRRTEEKKTIKPKTVKKPVAKKTKKIPKRIRVNVTAKPDARRKVTKTKKSRKYVQVVNYIPWLDEEEEYVKKWYMVDAKLMRTTKKITSAMKKAIDSYNKSAKTFNNNRKRLVSIIKKAGRTATGKKAAVQLKKLYKDVTTKKSAVKRMVKA